MATRHQARESVVTLLYAKDIGNDQIGIFLDDILEDKKIRNQQKEFALSLYNGVMNNLEEIDAELDKYLKEWKVDAIGNIERAILRLGAYEILFGELDNAVVINEAIEISKTLAADTAPKFINGVLDAVTKRKK
ncbi:MAG TPA: transcription antitermination factor NusB [Campylobacterales bacterium]|nr:transcription antitermination factor NusB [Campylobacterales bacterium]